MYISAFLFLIYMSLNAYIEYNKIDFIIEGNHVVPMKNGKFIPYEFKEIFFEEVIRLINEIYGAISMFFIYITLILGWNYLSVYDDERFFKKLGYIPKGSIIKKDYDTFMRNIKRKSKKYKYITLFFIFLSFLSVHLFLKHSLFLEEKYKLDMRIKHGIEYSWSMNLMPRTNLFLVFGEDKKTGEKDIYYLYSKENKQMYREKNGDGNLIFFEFRGNSGIK